MNISLCFCCVIDRYNSNVEVNDIIHIVDVSEDMKNEKSIFLSISPMKILVSNSSGLLVVCPDILVSPTKIADSCSCTRRGVLSDRIKSFGISSPTAILGNVRHHFLEVIRYCCLTTYITLHHPMYLSSLGFD
jgi:hypothetical protein